MVNCCKNSFRICDAFVGCPVALEVKIPASYSQPSVVVRIYKGEVAMEVTKDVIDGYATIDLLDDGPEGFINGYGSPIYELFLLDASTLDVIELQASGDPVTSLIFEVKAGTSNTIIFKLDY